MSKKALSDALTVLQSAQTELSYYKSLVGAFHNGCVPEQDVSLQHFIFAKWGRARLDSLKNVPALLRSDVS